MTFTEVENGIDGGNFKKYCFRHIGLKKFFLIFIYFLRDRETEHEWERGRETQNLKQAPGSELSAQSLMQGSNS